MRARVRTCVNMCVCVCVCVCWSFMFTAVCVTWREVQMHVPYLCCLTLGRVFWVLSSCVLPKVTPGCGGIESPSPSSDIAPCACHADRRLCSWPFDFVFRGLLLLTRVPATQISRALCSSLRLHM